MIYCDNKFQYCPTLLVATCMYFCTYAISLIHVMVCIHKTTYIANDNDSDLCNNNNNHVSLDTLVMSSYNGSSSDSVVIFGGAVGGAILLLMIIVALCIVILCMRKSQGKKGSHVVDKPTKLNTDVTIENNPSYDVTKGNTADHLCDTINPGNSDVPITTSPLYIKPSSKTSEEEYNYRGCVQPNNSKLSGQSDLQGAINMETNPSYEVNTRENRVTAFNATSGTKVSQSSHDATTKQYDYAYVHDDHLSYHSKPSTATVIT